MPDNQKLIKNHVEVLKKLQTASGLFLASSGVGTGYDKVWLRDNVYEALAFEEIGDWDTVERVYHALLDIFIAHKDKINWAVTNKPFESWQFIHARYNPENLTEFWEDWGNKQNDAIGAILFKLACFEAQGKSMIRNPEDHSMIQTLIDYVCNIEYWKLPDSGMWEEGEELHSSSIGAVLAALEKWQKIGSVNIPENAIKNGRKALDELLPRESATKFADLALLSLIYPYDIVDKDMSNTIINNVTYHLEKDKGLIRYKFDKYYNANEDGYSEEAEWSFGFSWLAIICHLLGQENEAKKYLAKAKQTVFKGNIPELYYSQSERYNKNTPLGWAESMFLVALVMVKGQ